jgi:hypothetical protein
MYHGLYRADILKKIIKQFEVFKGIVTDYMILAAAASNGKIILDDKSIFFCMIPRAETGYDHLTHITKQINGENAPLNLYLWNFICTSELYVLAKEMQIWADAPKNYAKDILQILINKVYGSQQMIEAASGVMPELIAGREIIRDEILRAALEAKKKSQHNKGIIKQMRRFLKYILPYGLVRFKQKYCG